VENKLRKTNLGQNMGLASELVPFLGSKKDYIRSYTKLLLLRWYDP